MVFQFSLSLLILFLSFLVSVQAQQQFDQCTQNVTQRILGFQTNLDQLNSLENSPDRFMAFTGRRSQQQQGLQIPNNTWVTVASSPPGTIGSITKFWAANNNFGANNDGTANAGTGNANCYSTVLNAAFRITFNQASVPQFGGVNGVNWEFMFGRGQVTVFPTDPIFTTHVLRANKVGNEYNLAYTGFAGFFHFVMPFTNGFKIEYNSGVPDVNTPLFLNVEWSLASALPTSGLNWVLKAVQMPSAPTIACLPQTVQYPLVTDNYQHRNYVSVYIPDLYEQPLFNWTASAKEKRMAFLGSHHTIRTDPAQTSSSILRRAWEGDYRHYADSTNATSRFSGTEDYYMASYYFETDPIRYYNYWGWAATASSTATFLSAYRFFEPNELGYATTNFTFTWTNGDPPGSNVGWSSGFPVHSAWSVFYYVSDS
jgi:hypothetical protein